LTVLFGIIAYFNLRIALVLAIGYYSHLLLDFLFHLKKERLFRKKIGDFYIKETYFEFVLDLVLILVIILILMG